MNHDLIRLAREMRRCHEQGRPWRLPLMTVHEMGVFVRLLGATGDHARATQQQ